MLETLTTSILPAADQTAAILTPDGSVTTPRMISTDPITTLFELTPLDVAFTPTLSLKIAKTICPICYTTVATQEVLLTPTPSTDIITSLTIPDTYISLTSSESYITLVETEFTTDILETSPTSPPESKVILSFKIKPSDLPDFETKTSLTSEDDFAQISRTLELPFTSLPSETFLTSKTDIIPTPITKVTLTPGVEVTKTTLKHATSAPPVKAPSSSTEPTEISATTYFPSNVSTTHFTPLQNYSTPHPFDVFTTPYPPIPSVPCGKSYCLNEGVCRIANGSSVVSRL